jgi:zinc transporter, ZIP family
MPTIEIIDVVRVVMICAFADGTSFAGALIARYFNFSDRQILFFTAFDAGILISAAIFGMVIEAEKTIGILMTLIAFVAGSIIFAIADVIAERKGGEAGILIGIGLDSIPESLAIGASVQVVLDLRLRCLLEYKLYQKELPHFVR